MKAIFRLPFEEKFILIHQHEAARNVASFFPFTNGKTIHLQAENLEVCTSEELKSSFFEVENFPEMNAELNIPQHEEVLKFIKSKYPEDIEAFMQQIILKVTDNNISMLLKDYPEILLNENRKQFIKKFLLKKVEIMKEIVS